MQPRPPGEHLRLVWHLICDCSEFDAIIVMDSDGEDRPADISGLLAAANRTSDLLFARNDRHPGLIVFRLWYH
jgi:hypothetical protein